MNKLKQGDTQFVSKMKQIVCPLVSNLGVNFPKNLHFMEICGTILNVKNIPYT